jgi:predicted phage-related endonuclease
MPQIMPMSNDVRGERMTNAVALDDLHIVWERYLAARVMVAEWEQSANQLRGIIETALGELEVGTIDDVPVVRWTTRKSNRLDATLVKEHHPDVWAQCQTTSSARYFTPVRPA